MDRVRFGRALGFGARQAMKTLVHAVDAAAAENPSATTGASKGTSRPPASSASAGDSLPRVTTSRADTRAGSNTPAHKAARSAAKTLAQTREAKKRLGRGGKGFGEAVWEPFARLSGVLWLEVTGVFFGIFALVSLGHLWSLRAAWHTNSSNPASRHSLIGAAIMFLVFGYFCISSFMRARRRERKR